MGRRVWKNERAISLRNGMELNIEYAREKQNRGVERLADLMALSSHFTLYKWLENGRMPALLIPAFEHACGANYVTQYLAQSANRMLVEIPTGRNATHKELNEIGAYTHQVMGMLIDFYEGRCDQQAIESALTNLIEDLAHQRGNVIKHQQPELMLGVES
ncbi:MAG: hypothetical protein ACK4L8_10775 [Nitrincola lacisaponensis]|uniref:hypothetical protein n=1 Tax=Nitrincola lacisaponensis TaxID=267850 RepID=UPI00391C72C7